MADDHASKAISAYGMCINSTPNIDRIADEGMRLDHYYVTNSICTPSIFRPVDIKQPSLANGTLVKARITNQPDLTSGLFFPDRLNISIQRQVTASPPHICQSG